MLKALVFLNYWGTRARAAPKKSTSISVTNKAVKKKIISHAIRTEEEKQ